MEEKGVEPLLKVLEYLGGWPVLEGDKWNDKDFKWFNLSAQFKDVGFSSDYLINFSVTSDLRNSSRRVLDLDQPRLGMSTEYLMKGLQDDDVQVRD